MLPVYEEKKAKIVDKIVDIGNTLLDGLDLSYVALSENEVSKLSTIKLSTKVIDNTVTDIDNEIVKVLALYSPEAKDLRELISYLKITNELARAAYSTKIFCKLFKKSFSDDLNTKAILEYALPLHKASYLALKTAMSMINDNDEESIKHKYHKVFIEESKTDDLYAILEKNILKNMTKKQDLSKEYFEVLSSLRKLQQLADRAFSIANLLHFAEIGGELEV